MESAIFVVATPIGNLGDITLRAVDVLKGVDLIAAEDTRHTSRLLNALDIECPLVSLHEHNEYSKSDSLLDKVAEGASLAIVSDAGTPLISDPGGIIVERARDRGLKVVPIPGPSAFVAAWSVAGLSAKSFIFDGFAPAKSKARDSFFEGRLSEERTLIIYEAPHRIVSCLESLGRVMPDRKVVLARELTKTFETILSGSPAELLAILSDDPNQTKGEFVVLIEGRASENEKQESDLIRLLSLLLPHVSPKTAAAIVAEYVDGQRNEIYKLTLALKQ